MSNAVFVLDTHRNPLMPCSPKRSRLLLERGEAAVFRRYPFTIILKKQPASRTMQPLALKIDPGSKVTGLALVLEGKRGKKVIWGAELKHRGHAIRDRLSARRAQRSSRRSRKTRHRPQRFLNRTRPAGWLPPSIMHRVHTTLTWARRLDHFTPLDSFALERVSFDAQRMLNADIRGEQYQKGTLYGTEIRAYLLHKWEGRCAYCEKEERLEVEHLTPRARGGSSRISNLVVACRVCNEKKGVKTLEEFLKGKPVQLERIQAQQSRSMRDAAAVNATKERLLEDLKDFGYPLEIGSGAQTAFNRTTQGFDKAHWIDAACIGESGAQITLPALEPLRITCMGRGNRQMCGTDRYGFPIRHRTRQKVFFGFQTGDLVRATVKRGKYAGVHVGRIAVRSRPRFRLGDFDVSPHDLQRLQRCDGYRYAP